MANRERSFTLTAPDSVEGRTLHATSGALEVTLALPMPSQPAIDAVFRRYGGVIVWALVAVAAIAIAAVGAAVLSDEEDGTPEPC
jgi:hypothetical protein